MGTTHSTEPTRTATFTQEDGQTVNIANEVIERLRDQRQQQLTPKPIEHRDGAAGCCARHAPLQSRPTAELAEVQRTLQPLELEHQRLVTEWQRRQAIIRPPEACRHIQAQLLLCYQLNRSETMRCARLAEDFSSYLRQHCDQARQSAA